mmetsp:Transcript_28794/g.24190  ORF Transcript_28794/g.24190 Transcript_28794/m.24190 type:complete len:94 (-) Transcript_28794:144-425(-)
MSRGVDKLSLGLNHTCALRYSSGRGVAQNELSCWGSNVEGQSWVKEEVGQSSLEVCAGQLHTCAITLDGNMKCWGWNHFGQCAVPGESFTYAH